MQNPSKQGKLIVIEGLDGSGKATQTALLAQNLQRDGHPLLQVSFPSYGQPAAGALEEYLSGAYGQKPEDVGAYAASTFFAVDRFASFRKSWGAHYRQGGLVLCDRYTTSNALHQLAKLPPPQWQPYLDWLCDLEFCKMQIPAPDLVLYLDMDPAVSQKLMDRRYAGGGHRDIHEQDVAYLTHCRRAADFCIQKLGWHKIRCSSATEPYPIEQIAGEIYRKVCEEIISIC